MRFVNGLVIFIAAAITGCVKTNPPTRLQGEWWGGPSEVPTCVMRFDGTNVFGHRAQPDYSHPWIGSCSFPEPDGLMRLTITQSDALPPPPPLVFELNADNILTISTPHGPIATPSTGKCTFHRLLSNPTTNCFIGLWERLDHDSGYGNPTLTLLRDGSGGIGWDGIGGRLQWNVSKDQAIVTVLKPHPPRSPEQFNLRFLSTNILIGSTAGDIPRIFKKHPDFACSTVEGFIPVLIFAVLHFIPADVLHFTLSVPDGPDIEFSRQQDSRWQAEGRYRHGTTYEIRQEMLLKNGQKIKFPRFPEGMKWSDLKILPGTPPISLERQERGFRFTIKDQVAVATW